MADITYEIGRPVSKVFRRAAIQRRSKTTGQFDGTWQDISDYVIKWGNIDSSIDDVRLNRFRHSGANLTVRNDTGAFNHETRPSSLWYGYLSRYRTLVRIQGGYEQDDRTELPTDTTMGIYIMDDEISIRSDANDVSLKCSSLQSIFDEVKANDIAGVGATLTASQIITLIRDHTDGAGNFIFRSFITSTSWTISSTSANYVFATATTLGNLTAWGLMEKLAECEGYVILINRTGGIEFRDRSARQANSQFSFYGQDFPRPNIIAIKEYKEAYNKYYNSFVLKYIDVDTATSYVSAGTTTSINNSNPSWIYGQRIYSFENVDIDNTATAQGIVNNLYTTFGTMTSEATLKTTFVPHVEILDRVDASFHSYNLGQSTIWDGFDWAEATGDTGATWSVEGENFEWDSRNFIVLARSISLDDFTMQFKLRDLAV